MKSPKLLEIKLSFLLILVLVIGMSGGVYTYYNLVKVVNTMSEGGDKQSGIVVIQHLTADMERAENYVRLYGITQNSKYVRRYSRTLADIDTSLGQLRLYYPESDWFKLKIDTIGSIVEQKKQLWTQIGEIWESDISSSEILEISQSIDTAEVKPEGSKISQFFKRLKAKPDTLERYRSIELVNKLTELEKEEKTFVNELTNKEAQLAHTSILLSQSLIQLISELESYEQQLEHERTDNAKALSLEAYKLLKMLIFAGIGIGLIGLIVLIGNIRKGKAYNKLLVKSQQETEELSKSKELFMAKVSHEIRTPLNAITGFIRQIAVNPKDDEISVKLNVVQSASEQLLHLINDVLDFNKLQTGKLDLNNEHFSPYEIIGDVCYLFKDLGHINGNTIEKYLTEINDVVLYGDKYRLRQIIYNLLSNALKFTKNGIVNVSVGISNSSDDNKIILQLQVADNGLGIEKSKLQQVFEEYEQLDQGITANYRGTGLGLSIVKKLVELFHGDIKLESEPGIGTTVTCNLMFEKGDANKIVEAISKKTELSVDPEFNILVADDEPYNQKLIASILSKQNVKYIIVDNGMEAIETVKKDRFDVLLLDIRMPIVDGVSAAKFIRETLGWSKDQLPIYGITADTISNHKETWNNWFNGILVKPFEEEELFAILHRVPVNNKQKKEETVIDNEMSIDLSNLIHLASNDMGFVKEMLNQFIVSTKRGLEEMNTHIKAKDYIQIADSAHKLASPCRHIGIEKLLVILKDIELQANNNKIEPIEKLIQQAQLVFEDVQRIIPQALMKLKEVNPE